MSKSQNIEVSKWQLSISKNKKTKAQSETDSGCYTFLERTISKMLKLAMWLCGKLSKFQSLKFSTFSNSQISSFQIRKLPMFIGWLSIFKFLYLFSNFQNSIIPNIQTNQKLKTCFRIPSSQTRSIRTISNIFSIFDSHIYKTK